MHNAQTSLHDKNFVNTSTKLLKCITLSHGALLYVKSEVCLKYFSIIVGTVTQYGVFVYKLFEKSDEIPFIIFCIPHLPAYSIINFPGHNIWKEVKKISQI